MLQTPMNKEELALNIRILANAKNIDGRILASKLRKTYSNEFSSGRPKAKVAAKRPVRLSQAYVKQLIIHNPDAGWTEMSRTAYADGYPYEPGAIRRIVVNTLGLDSESKRRAFAQTSRA